MANTVSILGGQTWRPLIEEIARKVGNKTLHIGVLEGSGGGYSESPGLSMATLGFWHEFGTVRSPPRPFLREALTRHGGEWSDTFKAYLESRTEALVTRPEDTVRQAMTVTGRNAVQDVKRLFTSAQIGPAVSARREEVKMRFRPESVGHPLVFSGSLSKAIAHEVVDEAVDQ